MQFFFLLLFNVFLGAVLYLVISLKLERSASEFRERRLRKEMDEIIKEFNITAERNITLLENKIRVLRTLLDKTGGLKSLDITLEPEALNTAPEVPGDPAKSIEERGAAAAPAVQNRVARAQEGANNAGEMIKKGLLLLFERIIPNTFRGREADAGYGRRLPAGGTMETFPPEPAEEPGMQRGANAIIEKDMLGALSGMGAAPERKKLMTEKDILEIVSVAEDRYQLVSLLSEKGCDIEDISRYSGMPAGEVRLVLNLGRHTPGNPA